MVEVPKQKSPPIPESTKSTSDEYLRRPSIKLLSKLVGIRSESGDEGEIADYIHTHLINNGIREESISRHKNNLVVRLGSADPDADVLLLDAHIDTVDIEPDDPLDARIENDRMYGRGGNDVKATAAVLISALLEANNDQELIQKLEANNQALYFTFTAEEEEGTNGMSSLINSGLLPKNIRAAIIAEPTGIGKDINGTKTARIGISERGREVFELKTVGVKAHSSRPYEGENAITKLIKDSYPVINWHEELSAQDPNAPTLEPTIIKGGKATNQLPDEATLVFDSRIPTGYDGESFEQMLQANLVHPDTIIRRTQERTLFPRSTPMDSPIIQLAQEVLRQDSIEPATYDRVAVSNATHLPPETHAIIIGLGEPEQSHTKNESVDLTQFPSAERFYSAIIKQAPDLLKKFSSKP